MPQARHSPPPLDGGDADLGAAWVLWTVRLSQRRAHELCTGWGCAGAARVWRCRSPQDPLKAEKQWRIAQAVLAAGPEAAVLYADEARIALLPLVRGLWHWVGQQVRIPTPGSNQTRSLFGALEHPEWAVELCGT